MEQELEAMECQVDSLMKKAISLVEKSENLYEISTCYLRRARGMNVLCGGIFVTRIARSFGLLSSTMVDALSVKPRARTFTKKSLITMEIVMELDGGTCCWPATRGIEEGDEIEKEGEGSVGE
ncbi:hypothetical protein Tco_0620253 [Tanacetum coccineum]